MAYSLERAKCPEEVGVDSKEIVEFFEDMKENKLDFHSFMVLRGGKVACEFYRAPFSAGTPHQVYSVSKSFTATAVGFALEAGLFTLDTKLIEIFPEYDDPKDERLQALTIRHLVSMTSGKNIDVLADKAKVDWVELFFKSGWYGDPGTFRYVNENFYMLCAAIVRTAGMSVREFLTPRLFEPLGMDVPYWETDQNGVEAGGWGLFIKLEDLAKLMLCYAHGGKLGDRQVLPPSWAQEAPAAHADNSTCIPLDAVQGYCYGFWRCGGDPDSYRADGMFSQFGIVFEKEDAIVISFGGIADEQSARDCIWRHFPKAFIEPDKKAKTAAVPDFDALADRYPLDEAVNSTHPLREAVLNNNTAVFRKKLLLNLIGYPVSMVPLSVNYMDIRRGGNITDVNFTFRDDECQLSWSENGERNTVLCGMNGRLKYGEMTLCGRTYTVCCSARWDDDALIVDVRPVSTVAKRRLTFRFRGDKNVLMKPSSSPCLEDVADSLFTSFEEIIHVKPLVDFLRRFEPLVPMIVEPTHHGRLVPRKGSD